MVSHANWRGLAGMLLWSIVAGVANALTAAFVTNVLTTGSKGDEVAINTYTLNLFVGWALFSGLFLIKADEEWKMVAEAVAKKNKDAFMLEAPKRIPVSIRALYLLISVLVVLSFHLFHIESIFVLMEIHFGVGFFVLTTILVLWDLDDPLNGVYNVKAPAE